MNKNLYRNILHHSLDIERSEYSRYIGDLERQIEEKLGNQELENSLYFNEHPRKVNKEYAEELRRQIELKAQKSILEKVESRRPHISLDFHGYPNLPQTPTDIRRKRELAKMKKVRQDLSEQLDQKKLNREELKKKELDTEKKSNFLDSQMLASEKEAKQLKKNLEKEALVTAWDQAKKAKELKSLLENIERTSSTRRGQIEKQESLMIRSSQNVTPANPEAEFKVESNLEQVSSNPTNPTPKTEVDRQEQVKNKAKQIREYIENKERDTYQFKIKQLIQIAKNQRQYVKRSISPQKSSPKNIFN